MGLCFNSWELKLHTPDLLSLVLRQRRLVMDLMTEYLSYTKQRFGVHGVQSSRWSGRG